MLLMTFRLVNSFHKFFNLFLQELPEESSFIGYSFVENISLIKFESQN